MNTTAYQVMPPLSEEEFAALKQDIEENGVLLPVVQDDGGNIIDGHHRARAHDELLAEGRVTGGYPVVERSDLTTDEEKRDLARRLNMQRRHLNQEQKREAIAARLKETPTWSDNRTARLLGVDGKTVRSVRMHLEVVGELPRVDVLTGSDGKHYPRSSRSGTALTQEDAEAPLASLQSIKIGKKEYSKTQIQAMIRELRKEVREAAASAAADKAEWQAEFIAKTEE